MYPSPYKAANPCRDADDDLDEQHHNPLHNIEEERPKASSQPHRSLCPIHPKPDIEDEEDDTDRHRRAEIDEACACLT